MKALFGLLFVLLLGGGAWLVLREDPGTDSDTGDPAVTPKTTDPKPTPDAGKDGGLKAAPLVDKGKPKAVDTAHEKRSRLWALMRPAAEQLIPDPDHIGPCPPVDVGGRAAPVIKRYRDPDNGFSVFVHDDGTYTYLHVTGGGGVDPVTGKAIPVREMVTTVVPTAPMPLAEGPDGQSIVDSKSKGKKGK